MDKKQLELLKKALVDAKIDKLLVDRFARGMIMNCNESCVSGCAACCSSGTANRAAQAA